MGMVVDSRLTCSRLSCMFVFEQVVPTDPNDKGLSQIARETARPLSTELSKARSNKHVLSSGHWTNSQERSTWEGLSRKRIWSSIRPSAPLRKWGLQARVRRKHLQDSTTRSTAQQPTLTLPEINFRSLPCAPDVRTLEVPPSRGYGQRAELCLFPLCSEPHTSNVSIIRLIAMLTNTISINKICSYNSMKWIKYKYHTFPQS